MAKQKQKQDDGPITVIATARGFYDQLREEDEVFEIRSKKDMGKWMKAHNGKPVKKEVAEEETASDESVI